MNYGWSRFQILMEKYLKRIDMYFYLEINSTLKQSTTLRQFIVV